jgi:hypothetical protein
VQRREELEYTGQRSVADIDHSVKVDEKGVYLTETPRQIFRGRPPSKRYIGRPDTPPCRCTALYAMPAGAASAMLQNVPVAAKSSCHMRQRALVAHNRRRG